MQTDSPSSFDLNGSVYDTNKLTPEGKRLIALITEAQTEMGRIDTKKTLMQAAQQQLITQLKPLLPEPETVKHETIQILGQASSEIPTTSVNQPNQNPEPLPKNTPASIKNQ